MEVNQLVHRGDCNGWTIECMAAASYNIHTVYECNSMCDAVMPRMLNFVITLSYFFPRECMRGGEVGTAMVC